MVAGDVVLAENPVVFSYGMKKPTRGSTEMWGGRVASLAQLYLTSRLRLLWKSYSAPAHVPANAMTGPVRPLLPTSQRCPSQAHFHRAATPAESLGPTAFHLRQLSRSQHVAAVSTNLKLCENANLELTP